MVIKFYTVMSLTFFLSRGSLIVQKTNFSTDTELIDDDEFNIILPAQVNLNTQFENLNENNQFENLNQNNQFENLNQQNNQFKNLNQQERVIIKTEQNVEEIDITNSNFLDSGDDPVIDKIRCNLSPELIQEIDSYKHSVEKIINFVVNGEFRGQTFDKLTELTDTFGSRMTGSQALEDAINWILKQSKEEALENIHTESFKAPHWIRNNESLFLLYPRKKDLRLLGLGSSVGTGPEGITAEVFVVRSFEELEKNANKAKGCIIVYNPEWTSYEEMVQYRVHGASRAAKVGAVASLVRSITPFSIDSPHTGWQQYDPKTYKIPTASITQEDAEMFQRFQDRGRTIIVNLTMGAQNLPDTVTRNTITELEGYELPEEVVVVSGHLDSWDVGVGAMDDGGGSIISLVTPVILKKLGLRAKRTIRTVLFSGEEQGLHGGKAYFERHSANKDKFQLLLESDAGTFSPLGISFSGSNEAKCIMHRVLSLLEPLNTTSLSSPLTGGPDIIFWERAGVPTGSILNSNGRYFWFHHSAGDTISVEDSHTLDKCAALWTAIAFVIGDLNVTLPR